MLPRPNETILTISQALHDAMRPKRTGTKSQKALDRVKLLCYYMTRRTAHGRREKKTTKKVLDKVSIPCYHVTRRTKRQRRKAAVEKYFKFELRAIDAWGEPDGGWYWNNSYVLADDLVFH